MEKLYGYLENFGIKSNKKFELNDKVQIPMRNSFDGVITKIINDENYEVTYQHYNEKTKLTTTETQIFSYIEIFKEENMLPNNESMFDRNKLRFSLSNSSIEGLLFMLEEKNKIDLNPPYQREHVWDLDDKVSLIKSIFDGNDIGMLAIVTNDTMDEYYYTVLDGKQRITAIIEYVMDLYAVDGVYYSNLNRNDRRLFRNTRMNIGYVDSTEMTEEKIIKYFLKLNSSGRVMDKSHIEKIKNKYNITEF